MKNLCWFSCKILQHYVSTKFTLHFIYRIFIYIHTVVLFARYEIHVQIQIWCSCPGDPGGDYEPLGSLDIKFLSGYNKNTTTQIWQMDWQRLSNSEYYYVNATHQFCDFSDYGDSDGAIELYGQTWESDSGPNDLLGDFDNDIVQIQSIFNKDRLKKYAGYKESEAFTNLIIRLYKV